jgi:hypothetical protein
MLPNLIKKRMSVTEIRVLIKMILEENGKIFIRKHKNINSNISPFFSFNIEVNACVSHTNPNNIRFQIQGGYINMRFDALKESGYDVDVELELNEDRNGYCLQLYGMSIFYKIEQSKFENILNNLKASVDKYKQEELKWQEQDAADNAYLPEDFWKNLYH